MPQHRLKRQVISLCVALIVLTSASILTSFWWFSHGYKERNIEIAMDGAARVLERYIAEKQQLLATSLAILTADYGFKKAVATNDQLTIASALTNLGNRIDADLMLLSDTDGNLITSNQPTSPIFAALVRAEKTLNIAPGEARFSVLNNQLYQLILQPVNAPRTVAYTLAGFKIDNKTAEEIKALTGLEISFFGKDKIVYSSTFSIANKQQLTSILNSRFENDFFLNRPVYRNKFIPLIASGEDQVQVAVSEDLRPTHNHFDKLIYTILWITLFILVLGFIASLWFGNRLTVPLSTLVRTARRFAEGDYTSQVTMTNASYEVITLSTALNDMGKKIQIREQEIIFNASHDPLTHLHNRNSFLSELQNTVSEKKPFVVIGYNLRGFRNINDSLGPQIGDACLKSVANHTKEFPFPGQTLHGRLGGDEFVTLIAIPESQQASDIVSVFEDWISRSLMVGELSIMMSHSMGVCLYPDHASDGKTLLRRTVIALEEGRRAKVGLRYYKSGEDEAYLERLKIIEDLKIALKSDDQMFMVYQPKLNLNAQKIDKVESLIRWQKPDGKWVSPELFIGLAEQAGLIIELTYWVITKVISQLRLWQNQGLYIKVAINVSAQDILHPNFIYFIVNTLTTHKIEAKYITLELTERDLMENEHEGAQRLLELKKAGFELSVDDYGIGQSSLGKLKKLPVDELKIDKSFILKLDQSQTDQVIVQSTIQLGHNLGLSVVAEGVENQATQKLLSEMGCDHIQGYFLCRPIPPLEFSQWLTDYENSKKPD